MSDLFEMSERFLLHLEVMHFAKTTIDTRRSHLNIFINWCDMHGITNIKELNRKVIARYQTYVFHLKKKDGQPYKSASQCNVLIAIKVFFKWLSKKRHTEYNLAEELEMPKVERSIPGAMSIKEVESVIAQPNIETEVGLRDRAILETFYATGIRRAELCDLKLWSIDAEKRTVFVEKGKGGKDRVVPIGERAIQWIEKYKNEVRFQHSQEPDTGYLFLNIKGTKMHSIPLGTRVKVYLKKAGIKKKGSCHIFRHSAATIMLEHGADIRHIQEFLGHECLDTTQRYTHVSIIKLQEVYDRTHPAKLESTMIDEIKREQNSKSPKISELAITKSSISMEPAEPSNKIQQNIDSAKIIESDTITPKE